VRGRPGARRAGGRGRKAPGTDLHAATLTGIVYVAMAVTDAQKNHETLRESERKWGKEAIACGFTLFPSLLLSKQHALGLECIDVVLILQIAKHWWLAEKLPYPSQGQLAATMNVDVSTVKRHLVALRDAGFITWTERHNQNGGQASNTYDLSGLIKELQKYAAEELAARENCNWRARLPPTIRNRLDPTALGHRWPRMRTSPVGARPPYGYLAVNFNARATKPVSSPSLMSSVA
jgi:hypothetical protein